ISRLLNPGADVFGWTTIGKADGRTRDCECFGNSHAVLVEGPAQSQPEKTAAFFQGSARRLRTRAPGRKNLGGRDLGCNTRQQPGRHMPARPRPVRRRQPLSASYLVADVAHAN